MRDASQSGFSHAVAQHGWTLIDPASIKPFRFSFLYKLGQFFDLIDHDSYVKEKLSLNWRVIRAVLT